MTNRRKIEKTVKELGCQLICCEFIRNTEHSFGGSADASSWYVEILCDGEIVQYDSYRGMDVDTDVDEMLSDMRDDIVERQGKVNMLDAERKTSTNAPTTVDNYNVCRHCGKKYVGFPVDSPLCGDCLAPLVDDAIAD